MLIPKNIDFRNSPVKKVRLKKNIGRNTSQEENKLMDFNLKIDDKKEIKRPN
mgnify:CR=1 FL=1